jgi:hypothetical protein
MRMEPGHRNLSHCSSQELKQWIMQGTQSPAQRFIERGGHRNPGLVCSPGSRRHGTQPASTEAGGLCSRIAYAELMEYL